MFEINRTAVIIRPTQAFADWLNAHPVLEFREHPISIEKLQADCTVMLAPAMDSLEAAVEWLQPYKVDVMEEELYAWLVSPSDWPAERTSQLFDEWFTLEVHSMIYDLAPEQDIYEEDVDWEPGDEEWEEEDDLAGKPDQEILKRVTRTLSHLTWVRGNAGEQLEEEEARLYKAMRQHSEYHKMWDRLDTISDTELEQGGVNPLVHVQMHALIEAQLEAKDPPEVETALRALLRTGRTRHQAVHAVGSLVAEELYHMLDKGRNFDRDWYVSELKKLAKPVRR